MYPSAIDKHVDVVSFWIGKHVGEGSSEERSAIFLPGTIKEVSEHHFDYSKV